MKSMTLLRPSSLHTSRFQANLGAVPVQRKVKAEAKDTEEGVDQPNRTGLPTRLKTGLENLSGMDLSHVKVHYNSAKPAKLNALAYTQGADIHVAPSQEKYLPHEGWHVVQQRQGRVKPTLQMKEQTNINDDDALEKEADMMGAKADNLPQRMPARSFPSIPLRSSPASQDTIQLAKGDYKQLWNKDPKLAKLAITQTTGFAQYEVQAKAFEQALGAGLFSNLLAHEGADALIDAIGALIGEDKVNEVFGSMPDAQEAGAIPANLVATARQSGNLREKMYMVYAAIRSGAIAKQLATNKGEAIPTKLNKSGQQYLTSKSSPRGNYLVGCQHLLKIDSPIGKISQLKIR